MTQTRVPPPPLCRGLLTYKYFFSSKSNIDVCCSLQLTTHDLHLHWLILHWPVWPGSLNESAPAFRSHILCKVQRIVAQLASLPSTTWFSSKTLKLIELVFFFHILCLSCSDVLKCLCTLLLPDVPRWVWPTSRHLVYMLSFSFIRTPLIQSLLVCANWL